MMTDENTPDSKSSHPELTPNSADKKGQMLVIYLPEGSVIVDRTDTNVSAAPKEIVEHIAPTAVPEIATAENIAPQPLQLTLQEVVQLAVQEVLQITGQTSKQTPKIETVGAEEPAPMVKNSVPVAAAPKVTAIAPKSPQRRHLRRHRKLNWVHGINTLFVAYLVLVTIVPAALASAYGMVVYASEASYSGALIAKGDLMVSTQVPSSKLKVNDLFLMRDENSWRLDARQVTSNTTSGALSTITSASMGGAARDETYVAPNDSVSYKVTTIIPKLGYVPIVLSSVFVKVLVGLFILILNLTVYFRRARERRLETVVR